MGSRYPAEGCLSDTITTTHEETTHRTATEQPWRVILYNCNCHTFDEVIAQLRKCGLSTMQSEFTAVEAHTKGRAIVYEGDQAEAERRVGILQAIGLRADVSK